MFPGHFPGSGRFAVDRVCRGEAVPLGLVTARGGGGGCAAVGPRGVITAEIENNAVISLFDRSL